jgi:hypothetical protein
MRLIVPSVSVVLLYLTLAALDREPELRKQSEDHQLFLLRDTLGTYRGPSDFYAGEVACAFNDTATCEEKFRKVLATQPKSATAKQIHHILAAVALREGRYGRSLQETDALLAIDPNDSDAKSSGPLLEVLSRFPNQAVQGDSKATVQLDDGKLPILINGEKASYFFDSGANLSVLTESEAAQFGMEIQDIKADQVSRDISGAKVSFRIALAKSVRLGGIELSSVVFLVSSNDQQPFVDMKPGQRGLIGLPILRGLGSVRWTREGSLK